MPRPPSYTEADIRAAVAGARSLKDALLALGLRAAGGNYRTLKRYIAQFEISTDHMDPNWYNRGRARRQALTPLDEVLVRGSSYHRGKLKRRLYDQGLKARQCELCGQGEVWNGVQISLILDHVNGEHDDNRLENLRIVCPNCNAGLDTHCGRQNRNGPRSCLRCDREFLPRTTKQQYCSHECGARSPGSRTLKPQDRKVERPSYADLLKELEETNYSAVGRKYGVSDTAVRKWVRVYAWQAEHGDRSV